MEECLYKYIFIVSQFFKEISLNKRICLITTSGVYEYDVIIYPPKIYSQLLKINSCFSLEENQQHRCSDDLLSYNKPLQNGVP